MLAACYTAEFATVGEHASDVARASRDIHEQHGTDEPPKSGIPIEKIEKKNDIIVSLGGVFESLEPLNKLRRRRVE